MYESNINFDNLASFSAWINKITDLWSMKWRTELHIPASEDLINHSDFTLFMGSCFALNMAKRFSYYGFGNDCNPTGILYNSHSILKMLRLLLGGKELNEELFVERDGMICHYDFHSDFKANSKSLFIEKWGQAQRKFAERWSESYYFFVTLGTAHVYDKDGITIANCHKQPAKLFRKRLQTIAEIQKDIREIELLAEAKKIVLTVSPVRHLKDGFIANQLSKSHLIAAIHGAGMHYFPSYELVLDDLRDYRFYGKDRVHPSDEALDYVWEKFSGSYFSDVTRKVMKSVEKVRKMQEHRAFNIESEENISFQTRLQKRLSELRKELPFLQ